MKPALVLQPTHDYDDPIDFDYLVNPMTTFIDHMQVYFIFKLKAFPRHLVYTSSIHKCLTFHAFNNATVVTFSCIHN